MIPDYLIIETVFKCAALAHEVKWQDFKRKFYNKQLLAGIMFNCLDRESIAECLEWSDASINVRISEHRRRMVSEPRYKEKCMMIEKEVKERLWALRYSLQTHHNNN